MMLTFLQRQLDGRLGGERVPSSGLALAAQLRLTTALGVNGNHLLETEADFSQVQCWIGLASLYVPISDIQLYKTN